MQWTAFALLPLCGALLAVVLAVPIWRVRHHAPAARYLFLADLGLAEWSLVSALGLLSTRIDVQTASILAIYPGVAASTLGLYWFYRSTADAQFRPTRRAIALLCIEPVLITIAAATNPLHGLVITSSALSGSPPRAVITVGAVFWLHSLYSYLLLGRGAAVLATAWRAGSSLHRRQITMVLMAFGPPIIANGATLVMLSRGSSADFSFIGTTVSTLIYFWAMRAGLLRIVPLARAMVLDKMSDAVVVVDAAGQIIDLNNAARELVPQVQPDGRNDVGRGSIGAFLGGELGDAGSDPAGVIADGEHSVVARGRRIDLYTRATALTDVRGFKLGCVYVVRDVTEHNDQRRALLAANGLLHEQVITIERLRAEMADQAIHDELTGTHNRRHLTAALADALATADSGVGESRNLALAMIDIDHFKRVNDQYGHPAGDELLVAIAHTLQSSVRLGDVVVRYGGEEFVVLFPGASPEEAASRADQLRAACALVAITVADDLVSTTVSIGVASRSPLRTSAIDLLQSADDALYRAKAAGRDCVVAAGVP